MTIIPDPSRYYRKRKEYFRSVCDRVLEKYLINSNKQEILIDVGSGKYGAFDNSLLNNYKRFAIDIDLNVLVINKSTDFRICSDCRLLPFKKHSIDVGISRDCLEHIPGVRAFFSEIKTIMKPGGTFITVIPNKVYIVSLIAFLFPNRINNLIWKLFKGVEKMPFPVFYEVNTMRKWKKFAKEYDFHLESITYFHETIFWFLRLPALYWLTEFLLLPLRLSVFKRLRSTMLVVIKF